MALQIPKVEADLEHGIAYLTPTKLYLLWILDMKYVLKYFPSTSQVQQWNCYQWSLQWRITTYWVFIFGRMSPNYNCYKRVQTSQAHLHDFSTTCTGFYTVLCSILTNYLHSIIITYVFTTWKICLWYRFPTLNWN